MLHRRTGFTLVELIIVTVVIAILATITIVAYSNVQAETRDAKVRDGAAKIAEAIETWSLQTNLNPDTANTGYGSTTCPSTAGSGQGWVSIVGSASYGCTLESVLESSGYLPVGYANSEPYNTKYNTRGYTYMIYPCPATGDWVLFYSLEKPTSTDTANYNSLSTTCNSTSPTFASLTTSYNMQGARLLNFTK
jgi:prepilin-type N-terminal cleavage/methylation domain-containing protein